jgi:Flp pilus assembly pilin Flp
MRNERGQAMVEFAMVVGLFLVCLLGAMSASVYTVQRSAAVTGVAAGARIAAGGTSGPGGANTPNLAGAMPAVARVVTPVLFGTRVRQLEPARPCPASAAIPSGEVDICAVQTADMVTVRLRGRPAAAVPIPGLDWSLDLTAEVHAVTFAG